MLLKNMLIKIIATLAIAYLAIIVVFFFAQRSLLYFPTPAAQDVSEQPISFSHQGQSLNGWVLNPGQKNALIYFGGNAESIEQNISLLKTIAPHYSIYLVNYRGYGQSSGQPTEQNLFADALFIYDQVKPKHQQVSIIGRSLGSGVAVHLAAKRSIEQLILVTPYNSITAVAQHHYPWLPVGVLIKDRFDSQQKAPLISANTLILLAQHDQIVPPQFGQLLTQAFSAAAVEQVTINEANHNDITYFPSYKKQINRFLIDP